MDKGHVVSGINFTRLTFQEDEDEAPCIANEQFASLELVFGYHLIPSQSPSQVCQTTQSGA